MGTSDVTFVSYSEFLKNPELQSQYGGDYKSFLSAYVASMQELKGNSVLDLAKRGFTVPDKIDPSSIWREQHKKYMANFEQKYEESQLAQKIASESKAKFEKIERETQNLLAARQYSLEKQNKSADGLKISDLGITDSGKYFTAKMTASEADSAAWNAILSARDASFDFFG